MTSTVTLKTITERLSALQNKKLQAWEKNFYNSFKKQTTLTNRQLATLTKIEDRLYKVEEKTNAWLKEWDLEKQSKFYLACKYYTSNYGRWFFFNKYRQIIRLAISNKEYIPSRKLYYKIAENKYANKAIISYNDIPKYHIGDFVYVIGSYTKYYVNSLNWAGIIIEPSTKEFKKKNKKYHIKPINIKNDHENRVVLEKYVFPYRRK